MQNFQIKIYMYMYTYTIYICMWFEYVYTHILFGIFSEPLLFFPMSSLFSKQYTTHYTKTLSSSIQNSPFGGSFINTILTL